MERAGAMDTYDDTSPSTQPDREDFLARIARSFYLDDMSKVEIAARYGISRFKVARYLQEARERGIVRITIRTPNERRTDLTTALEEHLGISHVRLVPPSSDIVKERQALGATAAEILTTHLRMGQRVGFSWGRTLLPIADYLGELPSAEFVQLTGVVGNDPSKSPIEIIGAISRRSGSTAKALIAPLFSASAAVVQALRQEPAVTEVLALYEKLDMAFLSVGSWRPRVTQLAQHISAADQLDLDSKGACADFGGLFFDTKGRYVDTPINECRLSVSVEQLLATPMVVAVAGQIEKVHAIHSVCSSGLATHLVTTTEVAEALLDMDAISRTAYQRN